MLPARSVLGLGEGRHLEIVRLGRLLDFLVLLCADLVGRHERREGLDVDGAHPVLVRGAKDLQAVPSGGSKKATQKRSTTKEQLDLGRALLDRIGINRTSI